LFPRDRSRKEKVSSIGIGGRRTQQWGKKKLADDKKKRKESKEGAREISRKKGRRIQNGVRKSLGAHLQGGKDLETCEKGGDT